MEIFRSKAHLRPFVERQKEMGKKIGFAPTMGALHEGHLALYAAARSENDLVFASIYVNPTQFNNADDLEKYPRDVERDIHFLQQSGLVDAVYIPSDADMYPAGLHSEKYNFNGLENEMEGKMRPGHFDGVGTVVQTLFQHVQPDNAYFGEKDFQQLAIIRKLVDILQYPVHIHGVPIFRNKEGLALSSRNLRLSEKERTAAAVLYDTLKKINDWFRIITIPEIGQRVKHIFEDQEGMVLEYFSIADEETLKETDFFYKDRQYRAFLAVFVGEIRLIDNLHLD